MRHRFAWLGRVTTPTYLLTLFLLDTNIPPSATVEFLDSSSASVNLFFPCMLPFVTALLFKYTSLLLRGLVSDFELEK